MRLQILYATNFVKIIYYQTRLLVTNAIKYLPEVDFIVVLKNGAVVESGTYDELLLNEGEFADFVTNYSLEEEIVEQTDVSESSLEQTKGKK